MNNDKELNPTRPDLVPAGAFSYPVKAVKETRWFGFLLLPEFTLLALKHSAQNLNRGIPKGLRL